jgi:hypothetical protein
MQIGAKMARKTDMQAETPLFEEAYAQLAERMQGLHISRVSEMPRIELYLDQVLSIIVQELSDLYAPDEKIVTGAMVNNYVKQHVVPAPTRKHYTRRHLASLLFVCAFKRVLSIAQIAQIFSIGHQEGVDIERAYDDVVHLFEETLAGMFPEDPASCPAFPSGELHLVDCEGNRLDGATERLLESAVFLLAYKVHTDALLALHERCAPVE